MPPKRSGFTPLRSARNEIGSFNVSKKILLAEDHTDIREMMATYLKLSGYEVIEASDGCEALMRALEHKPDAILMDIAMPVLNGIDSTRAMRKNKELEQVPILCLTDSIAITIAPEEPPARIASSRAKRRHPTTQSRSLTRTHSAANPSR